MRKRFVFHSFFCLFALTTMCLPLSGCYLIKQGWYVVKYTREAVPIKKLENNPATPDSLRRFLSLVQDIRAFASDSIGLRRNSNFSTYVAINQKYLVNVVYGAGKTNFTPYEWWFPFFGKFPYKGYFELPDAKKEAKKLMDRGFDAYIGAVDAFSSLGFFSDPVYSFMKHFSVFRIASLIIHEQTHATLYIKNQSQFNEEMAMFMGAEGALWFIKSHWGESSAQYQSALGQQKDSDTYFKLIRSLYQKLKAVYDSKDSEMHTLDKKQWIIKSFKDSVAANYDSIFSSPDYRGLATMNINNALIAVDMTYTYDLNRFYELFEKKNHNLRATLAALVGLKKKKGDPHILMRALE